MREPLSYEIEGVGPYTVVYTPAKRSDGQPFYRWIASLNADRSPLAPLSKEVRGVGWTFIDARKTAHEDLPHEPFSLLRRDSAGRALSMPHPPETNPSEV